MDIRTQFVDDGYCPLDCINSKGNGKKAMCSFSRYL